MGRKTLIAEPAAYSAEAFDSDQIGGRKEFAQSLVHALNWLGDGAVICLDGQWGDGKSWFAKNFAKYLEEQYDPVYIDAFKHDYIDDPFLLIASHITRLIEQSPSHGKSALDNFVEPASKIAYTLLPTLGKASLNILGNVAGIQQSGDAIAAAYKSAVDGAEASIREVLEGRIRGELESMEAQTDALRHSLNDLSENGKPIFFIIDELDRCKPTFAVRLLERIKHYFAEPNIVFLLVTHKRQLGKAIEGVYGAIDSASYLDKFIHLTVRLPPHESYEHGNRRNALQNAITPIYSELVERRSSNVAETVHFLAETAADLGLSIRTTQRALILVGICQARSGPAFVYAYLACLKVAQPITFEGLLHNEEWAHFESRQLLRGIRADWELPFGHAIAVLHAKWIGTHTDLSPTAGRLNERAAGVFAGMLPKIEQRSNYFSRICEDLNTIAPTTI